MWWPLLICDPSEVGAVVLSAEVVLSVDMEW